MSPKQIDKLKKEKYKQARLKGHSIKGSLLEADYSKSTAHQSSTNAIVKQCEKELMDEIKASDITVDWVVKRLTSELTAPDAKASDRIRVSELLGKYINMFKDSIAAQGVTININEILDELSKPKPIDVSTQSTTS